MRAGRDRDAARLVPVAPGVNRLPDARGGAAYEPPAIRPVSGPGVVAVGASLLTLVTGARQAIASAAFGGIPRDRRWAQQQTIPPNARSSRCNNDGAGA